MSGRFVTAYLLRQNRSLDLRRLPSIARDADMESARNPAVLVIPRSGNLRDPYLMLLTSAGRGPEVLPSGLAAMAVHVRANLDASQDHAWQQVAHVLVSPGKWSRCAAVKQMPRLLSRFPRCEVLVGRHGRGCLLRMRDGWTIVITGSPGRQVIETGTWPGVYGSVVYSWLAAGLPLSTMEDAVVITGHCDTSLGEITQLVVSAHPHIDVIPPRDRRLSKRSHDFLR
jgi:hypothetical protein